MVVMGWWDGEWWCGLVFGRRCRDGEIAVFNEKNEGGRGKSDLKRSREGSECMRSIVYMCVRSHAC